MKRKEDALHPILKRMSYTSPRLVSSEKPRKKRAVPAKTTPPGKLPVRQPVPIPDKKAAEKETSVRLIQDIPVSFKLSRHESPADFERMAFAIKARSKDDARPYLKVVHVEKTANGSRLVASDGSRLHVAEVSQKIEPGNYTPIVRKDLIGLSKAEDDVTFPDWKRVVPKNAKECAVIDLHRAGLGKNREESENFTRVCDAFSKKTGETVNLLYLDQLPKREWTVYIQTEKHKALMFRDNSSALESFAVIMPLPEAA